jgi:hypothetical protein
MMGLVGNEGTATEQDGAGDDASDIYLRDAQFESLLRLRLSWLRFYVVHPSPSRQIPR